VSCCCVFWLVFLCVAVSSCRYVLRPFLLCLLLPLAWILMAGTLGRTSTLHGATGALPRDHLEVDVEA